MYRIKTDIRQFKCDTREKGEKLYLPESETE